MISFLVVESESDFEYRFDRSRMVIVRGTRSPQGRLRKKCFMAFRFWMQVSLYVCLYFGADVRSDVVVCYFTLGRGAIPMFFFYCTGSYSFGANIPGWMEVGSMEREARGGVGGSAKKNCTLSSCAGFVAVDVYNSHRKVLNKCMS